MKAVLVTGPTVTQNSPAVAKVIASTHCTYRYLWRDNQAELAWVAGYKLRCTPLDGHPSQY